MSERRALRPDAQAFDEIRILTEPRYKTSGLSGDEWRISARVEFWRKGKKVHERWFRNVETAASYVGSPTRKPSMLATPSLRAKAAYVTRKAAPNPRP